jgi:hypothetical protein
VILKASSIEDTTQKELREIDTTGTLSSGEKSLADLRKRKLIVQKSGTFSPFCFFDLTAMQEGPMVHCPKGTEFQHLNRKARD